MPLPYIVIPILLLRNDYLTKKILDEILIELSMKKSSVLREALSPRGAATGSVVIRAVGVSCLSAMKVISRFGVMTLLGELFAGTWSFSSFCWKICALVMSCTGDLHYVICTLDLHCCRPLSQE